MERRDFLKYIGAGGVGAGLGLVFGQATRPPGAKLIPYLIPPEDIVPGVGRWYASLCAQCGAGCGIMVKVMEGRAKKIEGNPLHPVSKGGLCARGQAGLQALYNPDRIKGPLKRGGSRGSGSFTEIGWDEGISILSRNLSETNAKGASAGLYLLTQRLSGSIKALMDAFIAAYGQPNRPNANWPNANWIEYGLLDHRNLAYANMVSLGVAETPHYDIANTKYLLSFGADFSSTWLSPVNYSHGYGMMRQGGGARGRLVSVEPRMSLTGANADEWVPARPGSEAALALSMAHVILEEGLYRGPDAPAWRALLRDFRPRDVSRAADVAEERIRRIAIEFARTRPSLAMAGDGVSSCENGASGVAAINVLNHVAGNMGVKGGVMPNPVGPFKAAHVDFKSSLGALASNAEAGRVSALILYDSNPVFTAPGAIKSGGSLDKIPFIASMSSFMDETTAMADLILPAHVALEDWGDDVPNPGAGLGVATVMQPVVGPVYNTKGLGDIFIALAESMGGRVAERMPKGPFAEYLRDRWKDVYAGDRRVSEGSISFDEFWGALLARGGWWGVDATVARGSSVSPRGVEPLLPKGMARFEGDEKAYPLYLVLYPQNGLRDGSGANLPWLQELPDPMTSVVWGTWVEINPRTAEDLGIREGDLVNIESPHGKISAPAYLYPGIRPDTIAVPIGQGHKAYGRYAAGRGANPLELIAYREDALTGASPLNATRVRAASAGVPGNLVKMEGSTRELGRGIVKTVTAG
jgi:anaerobic selenocysteine-containing dehydrogenase